MLYGLSVQFNPSGIGGISLNILREKFWMFWHGLGKKND